MGAKRSGCKGKRNPVLRNWKISSKPALYIKPKQCYIPGVAESILFDKTYSVV